MFHSQIYSLQKTSAENIYNQIYASDYKQAQELLSSQDSAEKLLKNEYGAITCRNVVVSKERSIRPKQTAPSASTAKPVVKDPAKCAHVPATSEKSQTEEVVQSAAVKSFFKKSARTTTTTSKETVKKEAKKTDKQSKSPAKENIDDDGEWNDGSDYVTDKNKLKKRKANTTASSFSEREDSTEAAAEDMDLDESPPVTEEVKPEGKFRIYGAMDTYIEDAAIIEHNKEEEAKKNGMSASSTSTSKRRKLVEKVCSFFRHELIIESSFSCRHIVMRKDIW